MQINAKLLEIKIKQKNGEDLNSVYARATKQMLKMNVVDFDKYIPTFQVRKITGTNDISVVMYLTFDSEEIDKRLCDICLEVSRSFYMPGKCDCRDCKYKSFVSRIDEKVKNIKFFGKEQIERKKKEGK